ncbi:DHS-like NAD/FAD-binding domain-containing protein [Trametes elegans]|nr:DHS-like NAD/FAD-binding domain-containing protein [Trametes elegans]
MGNDVSAHHEGPPEVLEARDLKSVAKYIKSPQCRKVLVMLGAGGRQHGSWDTGFPLSGYWNDPQSNLQRLNLPYPEAVFEINYFRENPVPFYTLARELYPGNFRPTLTHTFVKLLADHKLLDTCFTQNIDTLERQANVPGDKIVEAHGSFASQHCIECHSSFDGAKMKEAVETGDIVRCGNCGGLVKPNIVFFGEPLPPIFYTSIHKLRSADLLIVIGTSLTVHPFASLTELVPEDCPRVLINMDPAGDIGSGPDDVLLLGRCDDIVRDLCRELGWEEELEREWAKTVLARPLDQLAEEKPDAREDREVSTADLVEAAPPSADAGEVAPTVSTAEAEDARVEAEVETLTSQVERGLEISEGSRLPTPATIAPESPLTPASESKAEAETTPSTTESPQRASDGLSETKEDDGTTREKL